MKTTLLRITFKKEKIHWSRMGELFGEMTGFGGKVLAYPLLVFLVSLCHYAFAFMHTGFECVMYVFNREQFKANIVNIDNQIIRQYNIV